MKKNIIKSSKLITTVGIITLASITTHIDTYAFMGASSNLGTLTLLNTSSSSSKKVETHSQEELIAKYESLGLKNIDTGTMKAQTNLTSGSYSAGSLSDETLNNALKVLNFVRYIAGLDDNVKLNSSYTTAAQNATLIMAINGGLSHSPTQPSGLSNSLYDSGFLGASKSNLSAGRSDLKTAIINGWMNDSDSSNISKVGHRRHILRPTAKTTGFGLANNLTDSKYKAYAAQYCIDDTYFDKTSLTGGVMWPAQNMPTEFFVKDYAWSYSSMNNSIPSGATVTLTKNNGEQVWNLSSKDSDISGNYLTIASESYGDKGCIIFKAKDLTYKNGDIFKVEIKNGSTLFDSYEVNFFDIEPFVEPEIQVEYAEGSAINYTQKESKNALTVTGTSDKGTLSYQWYSDGIEIEGATKTSFTPLSNIGTFTYNCRVMATYNDEVKYTDSKEITITITPENVEFEDIDGHWAKSSIDYITDKGWIFATSNYTNKYNPETAITRGDFVTALGTMENVNTNHYKNTDFQDVSLNLYARPYIIWANNNGIVNGMSDVSFEPSSSITREQMAVILYNHIKSMGYDVPKNNEKIVFADDDKISSWAKEAVYEIQQIGALSGKGNNLFDPQGTSTRAEFASLIQRFSDMIK